MLTSWQLTSRPFAGAAKQCSLVAELPTELAVVHRSAGAGCQRRARIILRSILGSEAMTNLAEKTCTPCRGGVPPLTAQEAEELRGQAPEWALVDEAHRIERTFRFRDFREALTFVQKVGDLAESEGHHPDVSFGWGYATVSLRTKKIKGLHENDFIMAAKIDRLAQPPNG